MSEEFNNNEESEENVNSTEEADGENLEAEEEQDDSYVDDTSSDLANANI